MREDRLDSWKEIAAYFRRGVRTVRRWEKEEGLPVHRHVHRERGTVYALRSELETWQQTQDTRAPAIAKSPRGKLTARVMIAVLPFEELGGGSDQEYVAEGLTDEMIGHLGRLDPLTISVIARTTMMHYRGMKKTVRQIGQELNVDYVMEGSVRREADRVRVSARLIDVRDQAPIWSGTYDETVRSILALQYQLAHSIGCEIRRELSLDLHTEARDTKTVAPEAYYAYLKGRHFLYSFTPESVRRSVGYLRQAIDADPTYAPSHASLAEAYQQLPVWTDEPSAAVLPLALQAANHALRLDPELADAHASLGLIAANYSWDWAGAERHFQRALTLNPSSSSARQWHAEFLAEMGRFDEALEITDLALKHDPLSRSIMSTRAFVMLLSRRFHEAIAQAEAVLEMDPAYPMALIRLGLAYTAEGRNADALETFRKAWKAAPGLLACRTLVAYAEARAGNAGEARKHLEQLNSLARCRYVPRFLFANICVGLGEHDRAVDYIEQEYQARGWYLLLIGHSPQFDPLRSNPRFQALVGRMKFPVARG